MKVVRWGRHEGDESMLMDILQRTPPGVLVLFCVLLGLGLSQCRDRKVARPWVFPLPLALVLLSGYAVVSTFPGLPAAPAAWAGTVALVVLLNHRLGYPRRVVYHPATAVFQIPGSAVPLALIITIFCSKYGVEAALALRPDWRGHTWFPVGVSLVYGLIGGCFLAAAVTLWRGSRSRPNFDQSADGTGPADPDID